MTDHPPMQDKQILSEAGKTLLEGAKCKHGVPKDWISGCHECYLEVFPKQHQWFMPSGVKWECCRACGIVRRADDNNSPCKGKVKMREPEKPMKSISTPTGEERESAQEFYATFHPGRHPPNQWHEWWFSVAEAYASLRIAALQHRNSISETLISQLQGANKLLKELLKTADDEVSDLSGRLRVAEAENAELRKRMEEK